MLKKFLYPIVLFLSFPLFLFAQQFVISDFENGQLSSGQWKLITTEHADSQLSGIDATGDSGHSFSGSSSMRMNWRVHNCEEWGGLSRLEYWLPDDSLLDLSNYDTLSFWYDNRTAASLPGKCELRFILFDAGNSPQKAYTQSADSSEVWYSFHYILDQPAGWRQIKIPLKQVDEFAGPGFFFTDWYGLPGDGLFNRDQIKGFAFEFAVVAPADSPAVFGTLNIDLMTVFTKRDRIDFIFNGMSVAAGVDMKYSGTDGSVEISEDNPYSGSRSIKWRTSKTELNSGPLFTFKSLLDYRYHWRKNPLSFKIRPGSTRCDLRIRISDDDRDGDGPDRPFAAEYVIPRSHFNFPGTWQDFSIPLQNFDRFAGYDNGTFIEPGEMDSTRIRSIAFLIADSSGFDGTIYLDDLALGVFPASGKPRQPDFWVVPDSALFKNIIIWDDLPEEEGETYNIYYSAEPIDKWNFHSDEVELAAIDIPGSQQRFDHLLTAALQDQTVRYYYAVTCTDSSGLESDPVETQLVTSRARGCAVVNLVSAFPFTADGRLDEWQKFRPFNIFPEDGSGNVVAGTAIDDDNDLSARAWLSCDQNFLYGAFEIIDDSLNFRETPDNPWEYDCPELFVGLYDAHNRPHVELTAGAEPDYHFLFEGQGVQFLNLNNSLTFLNEDDYYFGQTDEHIYMIEFKIAFEELAALRQDSVFVPHTGQRLPIDFSINDNDDGSGRQGILTYSKYNDDLSWEDVSLWAHTWVWDAATGISQNDEGLPKGIYLGQNYPNPFNPDTWIEFSLSRPGRVIFQIFDVRGRLVSQPVNDFYQAGRHRLRLNAAALASGIYFYNLRSGNFFASRKMVVIR